MSFDIDAAIRRIPHHPKPGIVFYDLMPLLESAAGLRACVDRLSEWARPMNVDYVLGIEARGFIVGGALAWRLGAGFVAARKAGKLPSRALSHDYELEYGIDTLEVHADAFPTGARVLVHDDLLATGGTAAAACALVEGLGGEVAGVGVIVELSFLGGRERLAGRDVRSLVRYASEAMAS